MKTAKNARPEDLDLIIKLKTSEQFLKSEVARLNRDVAKSNETWEKKFDILKQKYEIGYFIILKFKAYSIVFRLF